MYLIRQIEKLTLLITVGALFLTCLVLPIGSAGKETLDAASPQLVKRVATRNSDANDRSLIHPGKSVGLLSLGDREDRARTIFPVKPNIDQEWPDECGTKINWVDLNNQPVGNVFIRILDSRVLQIESATTGYHTPKGLRVGASPTNVRKNYPGLRAYVLDGPTPVALGIAPLIFWVDWRAGLAFVFASGKRDRRRYLYSIIVFKPKGRFCADGYTTDSPDWRELTPYSLGISTENNQ